MRSACFNEPVYKGVGSRVPGTLNSYIGYYSVLTASNKTYQEIDSIWKSKSRAIHDLIQKGYRAFTIKTYCDNGVYPLVSRQSSLLIDTRPTVDDLLEGILRHYKSFQGTSPLILLIESGHSEKTDTELARKIQSMLGSFTTLSRLNLWRHTPEDWRGRILIGGTSSSRSKDLRSIMNFTFEEISLTDPKFSASTFGNLQTQKRIVVTKIDEEHEKALVHAYQSIEIRCQFIAHNALAQGKANNDALCRFKKCNEGYLYQGF